MNFARSREIDVGIAVSGALLPPGRTRTLAEIAAFAGTSKQCIQQIEQRAIASLRKAIRELRMDEIKDR